MVIGIWLFVVIFAAGMYTFTGQLLIRYERREQDRIYFEEKKSFGGMRYFIYDFFSEFILTRHYIQKVKSRMEIFSPGRKDRADEKTMQIFTAGLLGSIFIIIFVWFFAPTFQMFFLAASGIYFVNTATVWHMTQKEECALLEHLAFFISEVRAKYQETGMLEESVEAGINEKTQEDMRAQGKYLLETICAEEIEEKTKEYTEYVKNNYLKELLALCVTVLQFGDQKTEGQSLFLLSLRNLKQSINTELLRKKRQKYLFSGYAFIIAVPVFFMPLIAKWAIHNMPSLERFYQGGAGILLFASAFVITWFVYQCNFRLQENHFFMEKSNILIRFLSSSNRINHKMEQFLEKNAGKRIRWERMLTEMGRRMTVEEFLILKGLCAAAFLISSLFLFLILPGNILWYHVAFSAFFGAIGFSYPSVQIAFEIQLSKNSRLDEILRFQSVILILSPIPQMTSEMVLKWMLNFADIFRNTLAKYLDAMSLSEEDTLKELIESENYEPFQRLLENLMCCDQIGVEAAFTDIKSERLYFLEEKRQEEEMTLENKGALGAFIAMVPTLLVTIGYLFMPVIVESVMMFIKQFEQINLIL